MVEINEKVLLYNQTMKQKEGFSQIAVILLAVGIIAIGGGLYFVLKTPQASAPEQVSQTTQSPAAGTPVYTYQSMQPGQGEPYSSTTLALEPEQAGTYVLPMCGASITVKPINEARTIKITENNKQDPFGYTVSMGAYPDASPSAHFSFICNMATQTHPFDNIVDLISMNGGAPLEVNPKDYGVFDSSTQELISKLYLGTEKPLPAGQIEIGFQEKDWMYDIAFPNATQATNQNSYAISVSPVN